MTIVLHHASDLSSAICENSDQTNILNVIHSWHGLKRANLSSAGKDMPKKIDVTNPDLTLYILMCS